MPKDHLEIERDAAIAAAEAALEVAYETAHVKYKEALKASQATLTAEQKVIHATITPRGRTDAEYADAYNAANKKAGAAWNVRNLAIEERYKVAQKDAYAAYIGACDAAYAEYERLFDEREAAEQAAEDERIAAEDRRQRREEAKRAQAARLAEEERKLTAGPAVTVTPYQAASMLGLTMKEFWALVVSGKYPEPRDDNTYDKDTIDRLPRPKVVLRKPITAIPRNIFTDIVRF